MITSRLRPDTASGLPPSPAPPPRPPRAATAAGRKPGPAGPQGHPHPVPAAGPGTPEFRVADVSLGEVQTPAARAWVLEIPPGTVLLTSNHRLYRYDANRATQNLKQIAIGLARQQRIPQIARADIYVTYVPPPRLKRMRHPLASERVEDADALAPTVKALLDGCTQANVWKADTRKHVRRVTYELLDGTDPCGQLRMYICEVPA